MKQPWEMISPRSIVDLSHNLKNLVKTKLWAKIIVGMITGVGVGMLLGPTAGYVEETTAEVIGNWLAMPGHLFLTMIQMIVIPLIVASVIVGVAGNEDQEQLKRIGPRIVIYFLITTTIAITIGTTVAIIIKPGTYISGDLIAQTMKTTEPVEATVLDGDGELGSLPESIISILPTNPLGSMVSGEMLQIVLFSIVFGVALLSLPSKQMRALLLPLMAVQEVCMTVVRWAMLLAPFAVFGLLAQITSKIGLDIITGMSIYIGTVLLGLLILLIFYMLIVKFLAKKSPLEFLSKIREVQLLAFSTSSSAAVMPLSIETAEKKLGIEQSISRFIVPLGATINMDGTALYQGVATIFLAQVFAVDIPMATLVLIVVTVVGASIGAPATPGVGIIILATVLSGAGIPPNGIALIIGVDRILDMARTSINVTGDLTAALVMQRWLGKGEAPATEPIPAAE